jgi:hypothetical protein
VAAAALADVLVGDANPAVRGGVGGHPLDQCAVRLLGLGAGVEAAAQLGDAGGKPIAGALELAEAEQARATRGPDRSRRVPVREGGSEEPAELPFEPRDLTPELFARGSLRYGPGRVAHRGRRDRGRSGLE